MQRYVALAQNSSGTGLYYKVSCLNGCARNCTNEAHVITIKIKLLITLCARWAFKHFLCSYKSCIQIHDKLLTQPTRAIEPMVVQCQLTVYRNSPTLNQHRFSLLLSCCYHVAFMISNCAKYSESIYSGAN